jgi:hypothetical protein
VIQPLLARTVPCPAIFGGDILSVGPDGNAIRWSGHADARNLRVGAREHRAAAIVVHTHVRSPTEAEPLTSAVRV